MTFVFLGPEVLKDSLFYVKGEVISSTDQARPMEPPTASMIRIVLQGSKFVQEDYMAEEVTC